MHMVITVIYKTGSKCLFSVLLPVSSVSHIFTLESPVFSLKSSENSNLNCG